MNWRVVALIVAGLAAAGAAAVLVGALQVNGRGHRAGAGEVEVLVAARDLPLMTIVDADSVARKKVPAEQARGCLTDSVQVVGQALAMTMVKDQAFRPDCIAKRSDYNVASMVPTGMRAVGLMLDADEALKNLLYPGSMVDVLASLTFNNSSQQDCEPATVTLLHGVQVLAVENRSIANQPQGQITPKPEEGGSTTRKLLVTLMVTPKDAELLQLAQQQGHVSLAMRNPMDEQRDQTAGTPLSQLTKLLHKAPTPVAPQPVLAKVECKPSEWQTVIYRGGESEIQTFPMAQGQ